MKIRTMMYPCLTHLLKCATENCIYCKNTTINIKIYVTVNKQYVLYAFKMDKQYTSYKDEEVVISFEYIAMQLI